MSLFTNHTSALSDTIQHIDTLQHTDTIIDEINNAAQSPDTGEITLSSSLNALHFNNNTHTIPHTTMDDLHLIRNHNINDLLHTTPHRPQHIPLLDIDGHDTTLPHSTIQRSNSSLELETPTQRQLTRRALNASLDRANQLKSSSSIARFSVNTVDKLTPTFVKNIAVNKWKTYGDPLVTYLDANVDRAVNLIDSTGFLPHTIQAMTSPMQIPVQSNQILNSDRINLNTSSSSIVAEHNSSSSSLESTLDRHTALMLLDKDARTMYAQYWERLKEKFVHSAWYSRVDDILLQNMVVKAFSTRVTDWQRPAEVFYNTVTEEFMSHGTYDDFLHALTLKLGPAWDDRLAPLAKGFFTTAKAVSALVGAGKFVGGALQLGRQRVHSAIDDLLAKWDRVLGLTDNMIDRYLPERDIEPQPPLLMSAADSSKRRREHINVNGSSEDYSDFSDSDSDFSDDDDYKSDNVFDMDLDTQHNAAHSPISSASEESTQTNGISKKRTNDHLYRNNDMDQDECTELVSPTVLDRERSVPGIAQKLNKRIRQRIPSISNSISTVTTLSGRTVDVYTDELKQILTDNGWFTTVDNLLMQNMFVKALANFIRPAEHFFNTSLHLFQRRVSIDVINKDTNNNNTTNGTTVHKHSSSDEKTNSDTTLHAAQHTASSSSIASTNSSAPTREPSPEVVEDFVVHLRDAMGASWDERLVTHAKSFLTAAIEVRASQAANTVHIPQQVPV